DPLEEVKRLVQQLQEITSSDAISGEREVYVLGSWLLQQWRGGLASLLQKNSGTLPHLFLLWNPPLNIPTHLGVDSRTQSFRGNDVIVVLFCYDEWTHQFDEGALGKYKILPPQWFSQEAARLGHMDNYLRRENIIPLLHIEKSHLSIAKFEIDRGNCISVLLLIENNRLDILKYVHSQ
ncbi:hypothetical protein PROFUN_17020, partial [Planoprotostelium fungivorum]